MKRRAHGTGGLFRHKNSRKWMIQYRTPEGHVHREPTGTTCKSEALHLLQQRITQTVAGTAHVLLDSGAAPCWYQRLKHRLQLDGIVGGERFTPAEPARWTQPAVYVFCDRQGFALYVGCGSRGVRRFADPSHHRAQVRSMCATVLVLYCRSYAHALQVERTLIAALHPRFNCRKQPVRS